jgi:hypothetical protein
MEIEKAFSSLEELSNFLQLYGLDENITYYDPIRGWVLALDEDFDEGDEGFIKGC